MSETSFSFEKNNIATTKIEFNENKRWAILHFWSKGRRSPAVISRITKTPKYNITKIKQQGTIEDRARKSQPRKISASDSITPIRRNNIKRTDQKTDPSPSFECVPMDGSTSTKTNELQEYFVLCYSNADTGTKACSFFMGNPTQI